VAVNNVIDDVKIEAHKAGADAKIKAHRAKAEAKKKI